MSISPRAIAWLIYAAFFAYWWAVALWAIIRFRSDPNWQPPQIAQLRRIFGPGFSARSYVRLMLAGAVLGTIGAFWVPDFWASIMEKHQ